MTKDEIKNRIIMKLRDPILQQGFEIICKENSELKARINAINLLTSELEKASKLRKQQFTKAKEVIKKFLEFTNNEVEFDPEHPQGLTDLWEELCEKAERLLNSDDA